MRDRETRDIDDLYREEIQARLGKYCLVLSQVVERINNNKCLDELEPVDRLEEYHLRSKKHGRQINSEVIFNEFEEARRSLSENKEFIKEDFIEGFEESIQGITNDIESTEFFEAGLRAATCVGKVEALINGGTGFLIGERLLMTNNHVIDSQETAEISKFILDYEDNFIGRAKATREFSFNPDRFFITSKKLDFTIISVEERNVTGQYISEFGYHPLIAQQGKIKLGDPVNIIHHPKGYPKKVTFRNNRLVFLQNEDSELADKGVASFDNFCLYLADTLKGSSGAPVFNDRWEVVAVHHAGAPIKFKNKDEIEILDKNGIDAADLKANEGIRVSRIIRYLEKLNLSEHPEMKKILAKLFKLWEQPRSHDLESESMLAHPRSRSFTVGGNGVHIHVYSKSKIDKSGE